MGMIVFPSESPLEHSRRQTTTTWRLTGILKEINMKLFTSIKGFILGTSLLVSLLLFFGIYATTTRIFDQAVEQNAVTVSETIARGSFNAMFQIMRQGWTRDQLEEFIGNLRDAAAHSGHSLEIYRGEKVEQLFGPIEQPPIDTPIATAFRLGEPQLDKQGGQVRYLYPLVARDECLRCHINATSGDSLGVIEVSQHLDPLIAGARESLITSMLFYIPIPIIVALLAGLFLNKRIRRSIDHLQDKVDSVNKVSDLTHIDLKPVDVGFDELNNIIDKVEELTSKLRGVAVDKELLEFEIRLLEKFVITSEVVRDWREYICYLLRDINKVIDAYTLFSIFKVDDELFALEVFWRYPPDDITRNMMEKAIRAQLKKSPHFSEVNDLEIHHNIAEPDGPEMHFEQEEIELQSKSLLVDTPKIGGIVGIGVQAEIVKDKMRLLVMESILSTLLNVVGSVKAIYKYTKDLEYYATRDPLTNLYNQRLFWELLTYEISRAERHDYPFALLVIDMDNFKGINDNYGHSFGDKFLELFADTIQTELRTGDVIARYGGDEFVVILPETPGEQAQKSAQRILEATSALSLEAPDGAEIKATVSIGMANYPEHAQEGKDLFLFADNMMYKAKSEGKNRLGIASEEEVLEVFRSIGEKSILIGNAIEQRLIVPYFQPIFDVKGNSVYAVEVLSRIELEDDRLIGAHEFIEIAEKMGVIHQIDYIVMDKAFAEVQAKGYQGMVFINLSPRALVLGEFLIEVKRMVSHYGIKPEHVVFEITERDTVKNMSLLVNFVTDLKMEGFQIAIDDFGSGFSSFHYLKRLPIDFVKIEGDFVANMANDDRDRTFVQSITNLAHHLNIRAIAEFVEDEQVMEQVRAAGVDFAQGYHIARPSPELPEL